MRIDTREEGLNSLYRPHAAKILQHLWDSGVTVADGRSIKELHDWFNLNASTFGLKTKSRSAITNALEEMERDGVIGHYEKHGQGGNRKMYYQAMSPLQFSIYIKDKLGDKVGEIFTGPWWKP